MRAPNSSAAWRSWLAACIAVRVAIPLAALAVEGTALPGLPVYVYGPLYGDANGYYAGAREAVSAAGRAAPAVAAGGLASVLVVLVARRLRAPSWVVALLVGSGIAAVATVVVAEMQPSGAPVIGWPLVWALPLLPIRVFDPALGPDGAFVPGLALSLVANAVTVVAVAHAGASATGRRAVGAVAAGLYAVWPFVPGIVVGAEAWGNGTWGVEVGLDLYTEPVSTALVAVAVMLILRNPLSDLSLAIAGLALGYATVVKLTDGAVAAGLVVILFFRRPREAAILGAGGLVFLPLVVAHWDKGYVRNYNGGVTVNPHPFGLRYVTDAWSDSLLFTPLMLALLVLPGVLGLAWLSCRFARAVIGVPIAATVVLYSLYDPTPIHPRFLYVVLPLVLVLDAVAVVGIGSRLKRRRPRASDLARAR